MVRWFGKPWKWTFLNYVHSKIAPHSAVVLRMILAIAAMELEGIRSACHTGCDSLPQYQKRLEVGSRYYACALRDFQCILSKPLRLSERELNEILAAFFLMVVYEHHFSSDTVGLEVHIRGIYTFLRAEGLTFQDASQIGSKMPGLSQQLLLLIMYVLSS
jgi:hypothetical protein